MPCEDADEWELLISSVRTYVVFIYGFLVAMTDDGGVGPGCDAG